MPFDKDSNTKRIEIERENNMRILQKSRSMWVATILFVFISFFDATNSQKKTVKTTSIERDEIFVSFRVFFFLYFDRRYFLLFSSVFYSGDARAHQNDSLNVRCSIHVIVIDGPLMKPWENYAMKQWNKNAIKCRRHRRHRRRLKSPLIRRTNEIFHRFIFIRHTFFFQLHFFFDHFVYFSLFYHLIESSLSYCCRDRLTFVQCKKTRMKILRRILFPQSKMWLEYRRHWRHCACIGNVLFCMWNRFPNAMRFADAIILFLKNARHSARHERKNSWKCRIFFLLL